MNSKPSISARRAIYTGFQLCDHLARGEKCFRAQKYNEGKFDEVFHEHVPSHRISQEGSLEALRALSARYADWPGVYILHSQLNARGQSPARYPGFVHHVDYPEAGVVRFNVNNSQVNSWYDVVVSADKFRPESVPNKALKGRRAKRARP